MAKRDQEYLSYYRKMVTIRQFETLAGELFAASKIPGFIHLSIGQEASAVGVCSCLRPDDYLTTTHRGHGHMITKGADLKKMMAELFGKKTGYCKGKGGSMHIADFSLGILGANGVVGGGLPIITGAGLRAAAQHSQSLEAWFVHTPGLKVVVPSEPGDVKGLIKSAIRDDNPVMVFQHKKFFATEGPVPEGDFTIPLLYMKPV